MYFLHKNAVDPPIIYVTASGRPPMHYWSYSGDGLAGAKQTLSVVMKKCCCLCFFVNFLIIILINVICTQALNKLGTILNL